MMQLTILIIKRHFHWILLGGIYIVTILLWALTLPRDLNSISIYQFFPILGILAWTTMWAQYVATTAVAYGATRNPQFARWTGHIVLLLIILHPSIFLVQRFLDTGLLPPESYTTYVGPFHTWAVAIAIAALAVFLSYGIFRRFRRTLLDRRIWPYVGVLQASAMVAIFIHGLVIGTSMNGGFFAIWWWLLGIALVPCLVLQVVRGFNALPHKKDTTD
jgi:hypothetical protein